MNLFIALLLVGSSASFAQTVETKPAALDFEIINTNIKKILAPLYANDELFSDLSLVFDAEKMSFEKDYYAASISATARNSNWSDQPTSLKIQMEAQQVNWDTAVRVKVATQTDAVALISYMGKTGYQLSGCDTKQPQLSVEDCQTAKLASNVTDLKSVGTFFSGVKTLITNGYQAKIQELDVQLEGMTDQDDMYESLVAARNNYLGLKKVVDEIQIVEQLKDGVLTGFEIRVVAENTPIQTVEFQSFNVVVSATSVEVGLQILAKNQVMGLLEEQKEMARMFFEKIQADDPAVKATLTQVGGGYLDLVKALIKKKAQ